MKYDLEFKEKLDKKLDRIYKKNKKIIKILNKKVNKILNNPYHFKPLKGNMSGLRRVHIAKSFVLIYEIDKENKVVTLIDFEHHDKVYENH